MTTTAPVQTIDEDVSSRRISDVQQVAHKLAEAKEFANWSHQELVQIVPYVSEKRLRAGELLYRQGQPAEHAFCLMMGSVRLTNGKGLDVTSGFVGNEVAMNITTYLSDAVATSDTVVLVLSRDVLQRFGISLGGETFYRSLLRRYIAPQVKDTVTAERSEGSEESGRKTLIKSIGWLLTLIVPAIILLIGPQYDLNWHQRNFLAALSVCLIMMSFDLTAQYAAALIAGLACLLLDVAPPNIILSGFASDGFFMALSIFGLGAVLTYSGLAERLVLNILRLSPPTPFWYNFTVMLTGIFMTPCLPSANTRIALMTPLVMETSRSLGYKDRSREATRLIFSMFVGASLFAPIFLTAKSLNFVVYSQMPQQIREQFQWLKWTTAASVAGLAMLGLYMAVSAFIFRGGEKPRLSKKHLEAQLCLLGPMDAGEWTAFGIAVLFIVAIITYSIHKISPAWITLGVFCIFLVLGTLREKHIRNNFEWDVLLLVGFFIGLERTLDYMGITEILTNHLSGVTAYMASNFGTFIILLFLITSLLRLFLPITTAGVLIASVFIPIASANGVNPWVVGFVILMLSETWWLPSQCSYFLTFEDLSGKKAVHDKKLFLRLNALSMAIRLVALAVSLPFFHYLGLL